jgi:hypothetical protein
MSKVSVKKISVLFAAAISVSAFAGCTQPAKEVKLFKDASIMDSCMDGVSHFTNVEYEQITYTDGTNGLSPYDKRYRGVVYLTEEGAKNLLNEYSWEQISAPEFEFDKVDDGEISDGPWFRSTQFDMVNYGSLEVNYAVFDGRHIVFDVQDS